MKKPWSVVRACAVAPLVSLAFVGCSGDGGGTSQVDGGGRKSPASSVAPADASAATPAGGAPTESGGPGGGAVGTAPAPGPGPGGGPVGGRPKSPLGQAMAAIGAGPTALMPTIGQALKADAPDWDAILPKVVEYSGHAAELSKYDPPKGEKESWAKRTQEFTSLAGELEAAVKSKDKEAALAAHGQLGNTCMACHREHRIMGPGRGPGRPGGFPGGGPPPGRPGGESPGGPPPGPSGAGGPPPQG